MPSVSPKTPAAQPAALYRKLRPRPHGPSQSEVVDNQRARLFGATIELVAARGYAAMSVAGLTRLAGISKRTFYEQFANKQECFLATYDAIADCAVAHVALARDPREGREAGLSNAVEAFVRVAAKEPKAARLALVEALGAGPAALARVETTRRRFERVVAAGLQQTGGEPTFPAVVRGTAYGIEGVVRWSVLEGRVDELPDAAGELARWALAHDSQALAGLSGPAPTRRDLAGRWPRVRARTTTNARIVRAAAEITAGEGYARLTPLRIADRAGVSQREFEDRYDSVEECCLAALDLIGLEALTSAAAASRTAGDGPRGVYRGIAALMDYIAEDPVLRGLIVMDAFADGAMAVARRERMLQRFVDLLTSRLPPARQPSSVAAEATVAAVWGLIGHYVTSGAAHLLPEIAGQAAYVGLAPVVGAEAAVEAISAEEHALRRDE